MISTFLRSLEQYEASAVPTNSDYTKKEQAALHLKAALDRVLVANPIDTFVMLNSLAHRMMLDQSGVYTPIALLSISQSAINFGGSAVILSIPYAITQAAIGILPEFDQNWFSSTNGNMTIKLFLETFAESEICKLKTLDKSTITPVMLNSDRCEHYTPLVNAALGVCNQSLTLKAFEVQTVRFIKSPDVAPENDTDVFITEVQIGCDIGRFCLDSSIRISSSVLAMLQMLEHAAVYKRVYADSIFFIPEPFYKYKFGVKSFTNGATWVVDSLESIPPSSY